MITLTTYMVGYFTALLSLLTVITYFNCECKNCDAITRDKNRKSELLLVLILPLFSWIGLIAFMISGINTQIYNKEDIFSVHKPFVRYFNKLKEGWDK